MGGFHGFELPLASFSGASASRVIHPAGQSIAAHSHDWACLTISVLGACVEEYDDGRTALSGPAAIFLAPGTAHANSIGPAGFETISILFDLAWLRCHGHEPGASGVRHIAGPRVAQFTRSLSAMRDRRPCEASFARTIARFVDAGAEPRPNPAPAWLREAVDAAERVDLPPRDLASRCGVKPATLNRAYRRWTGEGVGERMRRRRIERAVRLLRETDDGLADIAVDCGFYDQSHMNRCFRQLIGRTPFEVRSERRLLERLGRPMQNRPIIR